MSMRGFPYCLVVLRHGQSEWNAAEVFTGWANPHPTAQGELEATRAGALLAEHGVLPAFAHTSLQTCARMPGAVRIDPAAVATASSPAKHWHRARA